MVGFLGALSACVGAGDDPGPFPDDYQEIIKSYLHDNLKDPYSVQDLSISSPNNASTWTGLAYSGELTAWRSCVIYNAKNSFGGYIGIQQHTFWIRNGEVVYWRTEEC
jgi:hypothetical protein